MRPSFPFEEPESAFLREPLFAIKEFQWNQLCFLCELYIHI